jgi:AmmeMemoRadiSam system protein B
MTIKNEIETQGYSNIATAMCGFMPMLTLLQITQNHKDIRFQEILYKNSGDSPSGDKNRVVGYWPWQ